MNIKVKLSQFEKFEEFAEKIGVKFNDINLLKTACTHRSFLNENKGAGLEHNERLEFLGDAVLELIVTLFLFKKYPKKNEGDLTSFRAALVNTVSLSRVAERLKVNDYLLLSHGEEKDKGRARGIILADAVEAIIGAIYMDQGAGSGKGSGKDGDKGYAVAADFVMRHLIETSDIDEIVSKKLWLDAKSRFQEKAQEITGLTPAYKTLKETGPDHDKEFTLGVFLGSVQVAIGAGPSKQEAEQKAAEKALEAKGW
jgi:ribonuclease-3